MAAARRQGTPLGCIAIEIDRYDLIQQHHSEAAAHGVIKRLGAVLEDRCKDECGVFRADPSHLVIVAPRRDLPLVESLAAELAQLVMSQRFGDLIGEWKLSCIFGVAQLALTTASAADLLQATMKPIRDAAALANLKSGASFDPPSTEAA